MLNEKIATLEYSKGSNEGTAIYLVYDDGGYRIAGPKCWGYITAIHKFGLRERDLEDIIRECKVILKDHRKKKKISTKKIKELI